MATSYGALIAKRVAGVFLAIALAVSFMPLTAWAQPAQVEEPAAQEAVPQQAAQEASDADAGLVAQADIAQGTVGECKWRIESSGRLVIEPSVGSSLGTIRYNPDSVVVDSQRSNAPWYPARDRITSVYIAPGVKGSERMSGLFYGLRNLTSFDITRLDTSGVRYIDGMFEGCSSLTSVTVPNLLLTSTTDMKRFFKDCTSLRTIDLRYIDTSKVVIMDAMFSGCSALTSINFDGFKTTSAKNMYEMFRGCTSLPSVNLSGFDTKGVVDMWNMFRDCKSLTSLDLSSFRTDSLNNMRDMFYGCSAIKSIDISNFRVSTGTDRGSSLFYGCPALERVSVGDGWTFQGSGGLGTSLPTATWLSGATSKTFTARQIADERNNMADVYVKYRPSTPGPIISYGDGQNWAHGSMGGAAFRSTGKLADLSCVRVDGKIIARGNYEQRDDEGSTLVTLKPAYLETIDNGTHTIDLVFATGTASASFTVSGNTSGTVLDPVTMFRLYNPNSGEHFYTSSTVERDNCVSVGWNDEGVGWVAPAAGDPVYRLYNQYGGEHHYTTSVVERDNLISVGWNDEGVGWYSGGSVRLDRQYNPNAYANNHNYTSSAVEKENLLSLGWQDEGTAWYGVR